MKNEFHPEEKKIVDRHQLNVFICLLTLFFIFVTLNDIFKDNGASSVEMTKSEQEFATTMNRSYKKQALTIFNKILEDIDEHDKIDIERYYEELKENMGETFLKHVWPEVVTLKENHRIKEMTQSYLEHEKKQGKTTYWTRERPPYKSRK